MSAANWFLTCMVIYLALVVAAGGTIYFRHKRRMRKISRVGSIAAKALWEKRHGNYAEAERIWAEYLKQTDQLYRELTR